MFYCSNQSTLFYFQILLVSVVLLYEPPSYGDYQYPTAATACGFVTALIPVIPIPVVAINEIRKAEGYTFMEVITNIYLRKHNNLLPDCLVDDCHWQSYHIAYLYTLIRTYTYTRKNGSRSHLYKSKGNIVWTVKRRCKDLRRSRAASVSDTHILNSIKIDKLFITVGIISSNWKTLNFTWR